MQIGSRRALRVGRFALLLAVLPFLISITGYACTRTPDLSSPAADGKNGFLAPTAHDQTSSDQQPSGDFAGSPDSTAKKPLKVNPITDLATVPETNYKPLTGHERWKLYWKQVDSPGAYLGPVVTATVLDQATDSPRQWGPGIKGYGFRVASRSASSVIQESVQAPLAALLHEDVRYIASPRHNFAHRAFHAIEYSFVTYNRHGEPTPNLANLSALYASTAISGTWLPGNQSLARYTLTNGTEQLGVNVAVNVLQEFWPDIRRSILRRRSR